jgi:uncharacterized Zn finger protein
MVAANWTDKDTARALQLWERYQTEHDLTHRRGQTAGIEPTTGRVWFGESALAIAEQMETAGGRVPFYAVRVGSDHYLRKGGRR